MVFRSIAALLAATVAAALVPTASFARSPKTMQLTWSPTSEIDAEEIDLTGLGSVRLEFRTLADERNDRTRIGENREKARRVFPVTTPDDVALFVTNGLRDVLSRIGLRVVEADGDVVLSGAVRRFFATEINTYEAEVAVWVTASDKAGHMLWEGVVNGTASRWGREFKAANYCEVLSDSVIEAATQLLENPAFRESLRNASTRPTERPSGP